MSVISSEVLQDSEQKDGRRYIKYGYVIEDNTGATVERTFGPRLVPSSFDVTQDISDQSAAVLENEKNSDANAWISDLQNGGNPFDTRPFRFGDRAYYLKIVLDWALQLLASDPAILLGIDLIDKVSDQELKNLYGWNQTRVDSIRSSASDLKTARQIIVNYTPPLTPEDN